jgi:hypothetical protein
MLREPFKWTPHKNQSTDARHWGGAARSSVEVTVMVVERRGCVRPFLALLNWIFRRR